MILEAGHHVLRQQPRRQGVGQRHLIRLKAREPKLFAKLGGARSRLYQLPIADFRVVLQTSEEDVSLEECCKMNMNFPRSVPTYTKTDPILPEM